MADALDPQYNVVKFASGGSVHDDVVDGSVFARRVSDDDGLSVNWLEFYSEPRAFQIGEIYRCRRFEIRKSGRYAEINVAAAADAVAKFCEAFSTVRNPLVADQGYPEDPSHSLFLGLPERGAEEEKALMLGDLLAMKVSALHPPPI